MTGQLPPPAIPAASPPGAARQGKPNSDSAGRWLDGAGYALFLALLYPAYLLVDADPQRALQVSVVVAVLTLVAGMLATRDKTAMSEFVRGVGASACLWFIYVWFHWFPLGLEYWAPARPGADSVAVNAAAAITTFLAAAATAAPVTRACMAILGMLLHLARTAHSGLQRKE